MAARVSCRVLQQINQLWRTRRAEVIESATEMTERLESHTGRGGAKGLLLVAGDLEQRGREI